MRAERLDELERYGEAAQQLGITAVTTPAELLDLIRTARTVQEWREADAAFHAARTTADNITTRAALREAEARLRGDST